MFRFHECCTLAVIRAWHSFSHSSIRAARLDPRFLICAFASFARNTGIRSIIFFCTSRWRCGKSLGSGTSRMVEYASAVRSGGMRCWFSYRETFAPYFTPSKKLASRWLSPDRLRYERRLWATREDTVDHEYGYGNLDLVAGFSVAEICRPKRREGVPQAATI